VLKHQNDDGGFGLWPTSGSESFLTAYALWGLDTAKTGGYDVPKSSIEHGFRYLQAHLGRDHDMHGQFDNAETAPFAAYVLARSGRGNAPLAKSLAATEKSRFSSGLLGYALERADSPEEALALNLLGALSTASVEQPNGGRVVRERPAEQDLFYVGRDLRATAAAVEAMLAAGRKDQAADLVAGIFSQQRKDGSWGTTYNNLWALNALAAYASKTAESTRASTVTIGVDGTARNAVTVTRDVPLKQVVIPGNAVFGEKTKRTITLTGTAGSTARFAARLRTVPDVKSQRPADHGFSVKRSLRDADTDRVVADPKVGQLVWITLELTTPRARRQVALQDFLPAGFEAVDTALMTSETTKRAKDETGWYWSHRELHDERVTFFADALPKGTHRATYLARVTRAGAFIRPAPRAEAMYDPDVYGVGALERVRVAE
jgi:uncharacterized protein YfaS (alpha-2-macroglobulin family)